MVTTICKDREVGTNPGQKWLRYRGVQGMKYSYVLLVDAIAGLFCKVMANTWV